MLGAAANKHPGARCLGREGSAAVLQSSGGAWLLALLYPCSLMLQLCVHPAPGQEEPSGGSALGCLQGTGKAEKQNGPKWDEMVQG